MRNLTNAEEQIMQVLWNLEKAFVHDIIEKLPEPKPAYNTVSTIVRILEKKGFVDHVAYGKSHQYFPLVSRREYTKSYFKDFLQDYFNDSFQKMVSFFAREDAIDMKDMEAIMQTLEEQMKKKKN
jgi:predicted transcriptional regulator